MLRFTEEQEAFLLNNRRAFNARQTAMAAALGGGVALGNALTLPKDVWGQWDREGVELQRSTLAVFNDLAASVSTPMPIGKLIHYFQTISDSGSANVSLDGRSNARTDQPKFDYVGTPLPIIDSTFGYGWRQVEAARSEGFQLDAAGRMNSMRKVAEALETGALEGYSTITVNGQPSYGLRNHPKRNTRSTGVTLNGASGAQWLLEITATLKLLHADNYKVPATIYLNWDDWFYATSTEFTTGYPKTIAQRVLELGGVREVVPADSLAAKEIIAVVKDRRAIQVLNGMPMATTAKFRANPEDDYQFVTMAAAAVEIKFDAADKCGVAHST
ncbi:MAG: encapsulating for peroxidase [Hyphomicrobiaceae bacterium]|nr:MAG: encapsulating for peroxidase [Hyphomicrobiaceae bacterium]